MRARLKDEKVLHPETGKNKIEKSYSLYVDRKLIGQEFARLGDAQTQFHLSQLDNNKRAILTVILLFQRLLKPGLVRRCTLLPAKERAPLGLPSVKHMRMKSIT